MIDTYTVTVTITGAVDDARPEILANNLGGFPTTYDAAKAISRANIRFHEVVGGLLALCDFTMQNIVRVGRTTDAPPTSFAFDMTFYRDRVTYLKTEDELNPGTFLLGLDAIKRVVARVISTDYNQNYSFFDPTVRVTRTNTNTTAQTTPPRGYAYELVDATKLFANVTAAESNITVIH